MTDSKKLFTDLDTDEINAEFERAERRGELVEETGSAHSADELGVLIARGAALNDEEVEALLTRYGQELDSEGDSDARRAIALKARVMP